MSLKTETLDISFSKRGHPIQVLKGIFDQYRSKDVDLFCLNYNRTIHYPNPFTLLTSSNDATLTQVQSIISPDLIR